MGQTKVSPSDARFRRKIEFREGTGANGTNTTTTPTAFGWTETYTAGDHDETLYIGFSGMGRNSGTGALYCTLYVDGVSQGHRLYTYNPTNNWTHMSLMWKVDVDAGVTKTLELRQWVSAGTGQMWSSGSSHHTPTLSIRSELRNSSAVTKTSLMDQDFDTPYNSQYFVENRLGTTFASTSTTDVNTGVYDFYTAGDTDETVVIEIYPMFYNQSGGWTMIKPVINDDEYLDGIFYTDAGNHWRRTGRKYVYNVNARCTIKVGLYMDNSSGTGYIHGAPNAYETVFKFTPYPRQDYLL